MAVTYALATESTYKAGANVSSTATGASQLLAFGLMAEANINVASGYDWSAWYTSYAATYPHVAQLLVDCATNLVAFYVINYDMSGFTNIQEAVSRMNVRVFLPNITLVRLKDGFEIKNKYLKYDGRPIFVEELMETVKYCSLGQITNALYAVGGQYRRNM